MLSLEEAKTASASFEGQSFTPPPKTIIDIEKLLNSQPPADPKAGAEDRAMAARSPPPGADDETLAIFYYRRGQAAERVGLLPQALEDFRKAFAKSGSVRDTGQRRYIQRTRASLEMAIGDYKTALRIRHEMAELSTSVNPRSSEIGILVSIYTSLGDLKRAGYYLEQVENWFSTRSPRSMARSGDMWNRRIHSVRATYLEAQGNFEEAERNYRISLDYAVKMRDQEKAEEYSADHYYGSRLNHLTRVLYRQGKLLEAEIVVRQAIKDALRTQGRYSRRMVGHLDSLAVVLMAQGRNADAEKIVRFVLDTYAKMGVQDGALQILRSRLVLGNTLALQGRWTEAVDAFEKNRRAIPLSAPAQFQTLISSPAHSFALTRVGRYRDAEDVARILLKRELDTVGENFGTTALARGALAMALAGKGDRTAALRQFAKAIPILLQRSRRIDDETAGETANDIWIGMILASYIDLLATVRDSDLEKGLEASVPALTFRLAQSASAPSVQSALSASAARAAAREPALADLVRNEQDTVARISSLNGLFANAVNVTGGSAALDDLRRRIDTLRGARAALSEEIEKRFPDYASLMNPKPATIAQARKALRPGEALIATFVSEKATYVWAVPKMGEAAFATVPLGRDRIAAAVRVLRRALDPRAARLGDIPPFDVATAHRLYKALLGPVEPGWKKAKNLLVVAHGALGQLPFSVLVTGVDGIGPEKEPLFSNYRKVAFLARSHAVTMLPSVSALATLRALPAASPVRRNFAGFGDPLFAADQVAALPVEETMMAAIAKEGRLRVRGLPVHLRAAPQLDGMSSAGLESLPGLPDTGEEVRSIALAMQADLTRDVFTGKDASEGRVKSMTLAGYRVLAFATHGLVAGDLNGLTQPALALSSPKVTGGQEDGLLTMGEILGLRLDADWVVLSACNTASGNGAGAAAVSGLGRAFFYAGTRALLVSNWPVETTSARALTTDIFRRQAKDASLSRAEALRQSMLSLIDGPGFVDGAGHVVFSYAHPIFWAPFSLVGDGGGGRSSG